MRPILAAGNVPHVRVPPAWVPSSLQARTATATDGRRVLIAVKAVTRRDIAKHPLAPFIRPATVDDQDPRPAATMHRATSTRNGHQPLAGEDHGKEVETVAFGWGSAVAVVLAMLLGMAGSVASEAAPRPAYKNCKALNRDYPHGVGRKNARDKTTGKRVTNFKRSNRIYAYNDGKGGAPPREYDLDRDNDGIACEKL